MKKIFFVAALTAVTGLANAQKTNMTKHLRFSVGGELGLPVGSFSNTHSIGFGVTAQADYPLSSKTDLTLNTGYMTFSGKTAVGNLKYSSFNYVPLLAGVKYWFSSNVYGSGQLGLSFGTGSGSGSNFTFAPGIGFKFNNQWDALLKYTTISASGGSLGNLGLRVGYTFGK
jgi:hypothetical protein